MVTVLCPTTRPGLGSGAAPTRPVGLASPTGVHMQRRSKLIALALGGALALSACGGSSGSGTTGAGSADKHPRLRHLRRPGQHGRCLRQRRRVPARHPADVRDPGDDRARRHRDRAAARDEVRAQQRRPDLDLHPPRRRQVPRRHRLRRRRPSAPTSTAGTTSPACSRARRSPTTGRPCSPATRSNEDAALRESLYKSCDATDAKHRGHHPDRAVGVVPRRPGAAVVLHRQPRRR